MDIPDVRRESGHRIPPNAKGEQKYRRQLVVYTIIPRPPSGQPSYLGLYACLTCNPSPRCKP